MSLGLDDRMTVDGLFWRSRALGASGFVAEAVRDFDQVFATDTARIPTDALNNYGLWLTYLDRMQEASTVYREVLRARPR